MSGAFLYDRLGEALKAQRERFGVDAFDNRRRVVSLLADALPEARREIRAVASALDEGAVEALTGVERRLLGMEMDRQGDKLEQSVGLRPDLARQVIRALAYALDLGPPPSVYEAAPSAPVAAQDWAGVSQTNAAAPQPVVSPGNVSPAAKTSDVLFIVQGRAITRTHAAFAAGAVALLIIGLPMLRGANPSNPAQPADLAGELADLGVQPKDTLETNVGSATPMSVPGGQRVTTAQVRELVNTNQSVILVDVLADPHQATIQGARYAPVAGQPGGFNDAAQTQTVRALENLTAGRRDRPLVFFCAGSACWESYNAVLRARAAGYTQLYWYRGGLASWGAARLPMQALPSNGN
jgi:PQQ-dependent catabolism-associated CXXCW motif protein